MGDWISAVQDALSTTSDAVSSALTAPPSAPVDSLPSTEVSQWLKSPIASAILAGIGQDPNKSIRLSDTMIGGIGGAGIAAAAAPEVISGLLATAAPAAQEVNQAGTIRAASPDMAAVRDLIARMASRNSAATIANRSAEAEGNVAKWVGQAVRDRSLVGNVDPAMDAVIMRIPGQMQNAPQISDQGVAALFELSNPVLANSIRQILQKAE